MFIKFCNSLYFLFKVILYNRIVFFKTKAFIRGNFAQIFQYFSMVTYIEVIPAFKIMLLDFCI